MPSVYGALAHPVRREILRLLRAGDMSAGEIAGRFDLALSSLSGHLKVLRETDLIQGDRAGSTINYRLNLVVLEESLRGLLETFKLNELNPDLVRKSR
jgi:ArsR family transcriptional regulator